MKTRSLVAWSLVLLASVGGARLVACGDKALVPSRGIRFDLTPSARRQAAVLVYLKPTSSLPALFSKLAVEPALQKSGYQVTLVETDAELTDAFQQHAWDVVVVDLEEILRGPAPKTQSSAAVLAVTAADPSKADLKRAKGHYSTIVKSPSRSQLLIVALDEAVASSQAAKRKLSKKS